MVGQLLGSIENTGWNSHSTAFVFLDHAVCMYVCMFENPWSSTTLTLLDLFGLLGVSNVLNVLIILKDASLACWAVFMVNPSVDLTGA